MIDQNPRTNALVASSKVRSISPSPVGRSLSPNQQISFSYAATTDMPGSRLHTIKPATAFLQPQPVIQTIRPATAMQTITTSLPNHLVTVADWHREYDQLRIRYEQLLALLQRHNIPVPLSLPVINQTITSSTSISPHAIVSPNSNMLNTSIQASSELRYQQLQIQYNQLQVRYANLEIEHSRCRQVILSIEKERNELRLIANRFTSTTTMHNHTLSLGSPINAIRIVSPPSYPVIRPSLQPIQPTFQQPVINQPTENQRHSPPKPVNEAIFNDSKLEEFKRNTEARERHMIQEHQQKLSQLRAQIRRLQGVNHELQYQIENTQRQMTSSENLATDITEYKNRINVMEIEIERCNAIILKKNSELMELRHSFEERENNQIHVSELSEAKRLLAERNEEIDSLRMQLAEVERKLYNLQTEINTLRLGAADNAEIHHLRNRVLELETKLSASTYELTTLKASMPDVEELRSSNNAQRNQINQLHTALEETQRRVVETKSPTKSSSSREWEEQMQTLRIEKESLREKLAAYESASYNDKMEISNRETHISVLQSRIKELEDLIRRNSEDRQSKKLIRDPNDRRVQQLEDEINKLNSIYTRETSEFNVVKRSLEDRLRDCEIVKIELEGKLTQLNIELSHRNNEFNKLLSKSQQPARVDSPIKISDTAIFEAHITDLKAQIDKRSNEWETKRSEYEALLRKIRQEHEDNLRSTIKRYEEKISHLEKQRKKALEIEEESYSFDTYEGEEGLRVLKKENHRLRKLVNEYSQKAADYDEVYESMTILQERIFQFQHKISLLLEGKNPNLEGQTDHASGELRQLVSDLNSKIKKFKAENEALREKASRNKRIESKLEKYSATNKKLVSEYELKIEKLIVEVTRLRQATLEYEAYISQYMSSNSRVHTLDASESRFEERIKLMDEKTEFYRQKNIELESRVSQLLALNIDLKHQLEESSKSNASSSTMDFLNQQLQFAQKSMANLQEQFRQLQDENNSLRNDLISQNGQASRVSKLETAITELNQTIVTLRSEKTTLETERTSLQGRLNQADTSIHSLSLRIQTLEQQLTLSNQKVASVNQQESSADKSRILQLEASLNAKTTELMTLSQQYQTLVQQYQAVVVSCESMWQWLEGYEYEVERIRGNNEEMQSLWVEIGSRVDVEEVILRRVFDNSNRTSDSLDIIAGLRGNIQNIRKELDRQKKNSGAYFS